MTGIYNSSASTLNISLNNDLASLWSVSVESKLRVPHFVCNSLNVSGNAAWMTFDLSSVPDTNSEMASWPPIITVGLKNTLVKKTSPSSSALFLAKRLPSVKCEILSLIPRNGPGERWGGRGSDAIRSLSGMTSLLSSVTALRVCFGVECSLLLWVENEYASRTQTAKIQRTRLMLVAVSLLNGGRRSFILFSSNQYLIDM